MKEKKQALVPEVRFPEFSGEWEKVTLNKYLTPSAAKNRNGTFSKQDVLSVSGEFGIVNQIKFQGRSFAGESVENYGIVDTHDIVYTKSPLKSNPYGIIKTNKGPAGIVSTLYAVYKCSRNVDSNFVQYYFELDSRLNSYLEPLVRKGAKNDMKVSAKNALLGDVIFPSLPEQKKIAECLSSVDESIKAEDDRLQSLKDHKKGLMQKLFPKEGESIPEVRFPGFEGEWEIETLGSLVDNVVVGYPFKGDELTTNKEGVLILRGLSIGEGVLKHGLEYDRYYLGKIDDLNKYVLKTNDIVLGMDGSIGRNIAIISQNENDSLLIQRVARIRVGKKPLHIIYQQLISKRFKDYVGSEKVGAVIAHISQKQIENYPIFLPPSPLEQQMIADCLSSLDDEIAAQQQKVDALKEHKKGLMQKMFPKVSNN